MSTPKIIFQVIPSMDDAFSKMHLSLQAAVKDAWEQRDKQYGCAIRAWAIEGSGLTSVCEIVHDDNYLAFFSPEQIAKLIDADEKVFQRLDYALHNAQDTDDILEAL